MALATVSVIFLRWLPQHGFPILLLVAVSSAAAAAIYFGQRRRYRASSHGILHENIGADLTAVVWIAFAGVALGGLGIAVVLLG